MRSCQHFLRKKWQELRMCATEGENFRVHGLEKEFFEKRGSAEAIWSEVLESMMRMVYSIIQIYYTYDTLVICSMVDI